MISGQMMVSGFFFFTAKILSQWFGMFLMLSGVGLLARRAYRLPLLSLVDWISSVWLGLALTIGLLQIIHLFYPINIWIFVLLLIIGGYGLILCHKDIFKITRVNHSQNVIFAIALFAIAVWMSNRALSPVLRSDTGLYHLAAVQWITRYPIVKGLGNLHGRLAFNNSSFLFDALVDVGWWENQSSHIANSFLLLMLLVQLITDIHRFFSIKEQPIQVALFSLLLLPIVIPEVSNGDATSLSPDLPIFVISIITARLLLELLHSDWKDSQQKEFQIFSIIALIVLGISIKLSFFVFGVSIGFLAVFTTYWSMIRLRRFADLRRLFPLMLLVGSYLIVWMLRGILLSGYVAYPSTIGAFPVLWKVPRSLALSDAKWIFSWGRKPGEPWVDVLADWSWVGPWAQSIPIDWKKAFVLILLAVILYLFIPNRKRSVETPWWFVVPPFLSLLYWFFTAPSFRFANASIWLLTASLIMMAIDRIRLLNPSKAFLPIVFCLVFGVFVWPESRQWLVYPNKTFVLPSLSTQEVSLKETKSKLQIAIPGPQSIRCWNYPQPCTPYYRPTLHLLQADKLEGGFYLDSSFTYADIQQSTLPSGISTDPDIGIELISNLIRKNNSAQTKSSMTLRLLMFSRQTANYKMTVTFHLEGKRKNLDVGSLNIFVNDKLALASPLSVASQISASLPLEADFNTVVLSSSRLPLILGHEDSTDDIENWIQLDLISIHQ